MTNVRAKVLAVLAVGLSGCTLTAAQDPLQDADANGFFIGDGGCLPFGAGGADGGGPGFDSSPVIEPAAPPPALSGGTLAVLPDDTLVVADPDRDLVYLVSPDNQLTTLTLERGDEPGRVIAGSAGRAFVALRRSGQVVELDVANHEVLARHPVCQLPRGLGWSEARQTLYVACATGEVTELRFTHADLPENDTQFVAEDLRDVVVVDDGILLSTFRSAQVLERTHDHRRLPRPSVHRETVTDELTSKAIEFEPRVAWRMVPSGRGGALMAYQHAMVNVAAELRCAFGTSYGGGNNPGIVHTAIARLSASGAVTTHVVRAAVLPVDIAVSRDDVALVSAGTGAVFALGVSGKFEPVSFKETLQATALGYRSNNLLVVFSREPAKLVFAYPRDPQSSVPATIALSQTSVRSTGHEIFHTSTSNQIACASCHPEAGEDGHTWLLPEGARRTPSLRGGLIGTAPFHWAGDQADMRALMSEVLTRRMGGSNHSDERIAAELKWLDAQPARPAPNSLNSQSVERGRALFASPAVGCASCHSGPLGTNNASSTVGTGLSLQVPRLVELAYRAPFFHDGRVPTLAARFTAIGGGDAHGHVSQLTAGEVTDLVTYLRSR